MKKILSEILILIILFSCFPAASFGERSLIKPLQYPLGTVYTTEPHFIWNDIHNGGMGYSFRITLEDKTAKLSKPEIYIFEPSIYYKTYYTFTLPKPLKASNYAYTIDLLSNGKPAKYNYYNYLKYPIADTFTIGAGNGAVDRLPPEYLIKYKYFEKENMLMNGYNILFYGSSSTITLGLGIMFYTIFNFGAAAVIISYICFGTAITGYTATGYYTYKFLSKKAGMNEILKLGGNVKIKGDVNRKKFDTGAELSF